MSDKKTRTVTVTITRYYYKASDIQVEVPLDMSDEELTSYLTEDEDVDEKLEEALAQASLNSEGETDYHYSDPTNNMGGSL
jgi:hypothetical protein